MVQFSILIIHNQGMGVPNLLATTPTLDVFIDSLIRVLSSLRSNLVAIVEDKENPEMTLKVTTQLREADIHVAEVVFSSLSISVIRSIQILPTDHPLLTRALNDSDSTIIVSLLNKTMVCPSSLFLLISFLLLSSSILFLVLQSITSISYGSQFRSKGRLFLLKNRLQFYLINRLLRYYLPLPSL